MARIVKIGDIELGGEPGGIHGKVPVAVQTMYDKSLASIPGDSSFIGRMNVLKAMGCSLIRFSYPDISQHEALEYVVRNTPMPVVADIHFDYRNALDAIKCGVAKIRINPGNIGARWKTVEVVKAALDAGVAIRIGLNSGSLPHNPEEKDIPRLMVDTALEYISWFEEQGFYNTVVSLKASDPDAAYEANRIFASQSDYPLHLGVTEAGGVVASCVRSTWTLGRLLSEGIGSTIRYSITGSIEDEVYAGAELLRTLRIPIAGQSGGGVRIVSCPMCGRKTFDTQAFLRDAQAEILAAGARLSAGKDSGSAAGRSETDRPITVAIMGCQVNGPGESRGADFAVSGVGNKIFIYKDGKIVEETSESCAKEALVRLIAGREC